MSQTFETYQSTRTTHQTISCW